MTRNRNSQLAGLALTTLIASTAGCPLENPDDGGVSVSLPSDAGVSSLFCMPQALASFVDRDWLPDACHVPCQRSFHDLASDSTSSRTYSVDEQLRLTGMEETLADGTAGRNYHLDWRNDGVEIARREVRGVVDGSPYYEESTTSVNFDERGNPVGAVFRSPNPAVSSAPTEIWTSFSYHEDGLLRSSESTDQDGQFYEDVLLVYDDDRRLGAVEFDRTNDGSPERRYEFAYSEGHVSTHTIDALDNGQTLIAFIHYDSQGRQVLWEQAADSEDEVVGQMYTNDAGVIIKKAASYHYSCNPAE